jgi:UDP-N-acetyl-D-glucosamine 4,6-dehydratase
MLKRQLFFIIFDVLIIALSVYIAFSLRFDFNIDPKFHPSIYFSIFFLVVIRVFLFYLFDIYNISWRHFGFKDMVKLIYIMTASTIFILLIAYIFRSIEFVIPRSIIPIEFFISLFSILALRVSKRMYLESFKKNALGKPTLIIASNDQANSIVRTLTNKTQYYPVAIIDDDYSNVRINNINVYSFEQFLEKKIECEVAIVDENINIKDVYDKLKSVNIKEIKVASSYSNYGAKLHEISVEDLLARYPQDLDKKVIKEFIKHKTILITGAGGSIGSEIARQCVLYDAKELILLDHSEYNLYQITEELQEMSVAPVLQTVTNKDALEKTFAKYSPNIVIHAAAYKHVPLVEENINEAITNNILGTKNTIDLSIEYNVDKFVLVSTDKAVRPTNIMGATKRICELYAQNSNGNGTDIVAVRFGNVLGSSGSVIPKFKRQIEEGKDITVTHPDITRYFMLIPEACELVLQAGAIGNGGEIFILDMGEPIRIVDLAKKMIELSGRDDIGIKFIGLRSGEKLYEELLINESDRKTEYESITVAKQTMYNIDKLNDDIISLLKTDNKLAQLKKIVPEFEHNKNN